jgi:5-methylcytosine-specific restriction enzyme subunit McrC
VVGRLQLDEGTTLELLPKYPLVNLCRMISVALAVPRLFDPPAQLGEGTLPDLLVAAFVGRAEALVNAGLRRAYVEHDERLGVLRGRLQLHDQLRRPAELATDLSCRYEDFTFDTPFNAVLRQTALACHSAWPALATRVARLRQRLAVLSPPRLTPGAVARFRYDRLTEAYRPVHALCRLILAGTEAGLGERPTPGASFVVETAPLFEGFVSRSLQARLASPWRVELQRSDSLDGGGAIEIRPDVVVFRGDQVVAVIDAKYKVRTGGAPESTDAYQALAYARRYGVRRGWLVYPDLPRGTATYEVHDRRNEVACHGLDLSSPWATVEASLDELAEAVRRASP